jgi:tetratricopeptide (TPR) repeat protein
MARCTFVRIRTSIALRRVSSALAPAPWPRAAALVAAIAFAAASPAAQAPSPSPARAKQAYEKAIELEREEAYGAALALLWEASGLSPHDPEIQNRLGESLERLGALDAAVEAYRRALAERPDFAKASNNLILALVKTGNGPEAVARARARLAADPRDADRQFTLGLALSEQDVDASIATFTRLLEQSPGHVLARYNLALVLRRADRLPEALTELNRALAIEPRAEVHYTIGVIRWHQGQLGPAVDALRAAVALQPKYADGFDALGSVLKASGDLPGAAAALKQAIALRPAIPALRYNLALVLQAAGDAAGAKTAFDDAERLRQRAAAEHEALVATSVGIQKVESGDLESALAQFRRAILGFEPYAPAHYQLGLVLRRLGQADAAKAAFARARALNPALVPPGETR